jgi:hypothetical protein
MKKRKKVQNAKILCKDGGQLGAFSHWSIYIEQAFLNLLGTLHTYGQLFNMILGGIFGFFKKTCRFFLTG